MSSTHFEAGQTVLLLDARRQAIGEVTVERSEGGLARYSERPASLVHLLRASVDRDGTAIAIVEVGGRSLSYSELWDGAARVAGGRPVGGQFAAQRGPCGQPPGGGQVPAPGGEQAGSQQPQRVPAPLVLALVGKHRGA